MGATASIEQIYDLATSWFQNYFDEGLYVADFHSIDKNNDGDISNEEMLRWIQKKSVEAKEAKAKSSTTTGGGWDIILCNEEILKIAHNRSAKTLVTVGDKGFAKPTKIVDVNEFHDWIEGGDVGNLSLSIEEFELALKTFTTKYSRESFTTHEINEAFLLLDTNKNDSIQFLEVCDFCCQFINKNHPMKAAEGDNEKDDDQAAPVFLSSGNLRMASNRNLKQELSNKDKPTLKGSNTDKNLSMMESLAEELSVNQRVADRVALGHFTAEGLLDEHAAHHEGIAERETNEQEEN